STPWALKRSVAARRRATRVRSLRTVCGFRATNRCYVNIDKTGSRDDGGRMFSLIVHALLGLATIGFIVRSNAAIFGGPVTGPRFSGLELALYAIGVASIIAGWSFN